MTTFVLLLVIGLSYHPLFVTAQTVGPISSAVSPSCTQTWVLTSNTNYGGGTPNGAANLAACQAACLSISGCLAIDFNTNSPPGQQCWTLTSLSGTKFNLNGINHYDLNVTCTTPSSSCTPTWTPTLNTNYGGGTPNGAANLAACQAACLSISGCIAVDFNTNSPVGQQCWTLTSLTGTKFNLNGINHYDLNRNCAPTCNIVWTPVLTTNYAGGTVNPANNLADCQTACVNIPTCIAVDFNTNAPAGQMCWTLTSLTGTKFNLPGVNHYDLNRCSTTSPYFIVLTYAGGVLSVEPATSRVIVADNINSATIFTSTTPCLASTVPGFNNTGNCSSWVSVDGNYLRSLWGYVVAQPQANQYFPVRFSEDASFIVQSDPDYPGFKTLQPAVYPDSTYYFQVQNNYLTAAVDGTFNDDYAEFFLQPVTLSSNTSAPVTTTCPNIWSRISGAMGSPNVYRYFYTTSIITCRQKCLVYPGCVGVTFDSNYCYLETNAAVSLVQQTTAVYFQLSTTYQDSCSRGCIDTFTPQTANFLPLSANNYWSLTAYQCRSQCANDPSCVGISWTLNSTSGSTNCSTFYAYALVNGTITLNYWARTASFKACGGCDPRTYIVLNTTDVAAVQQTGVSGYRDCYTACVNNRLCTGYDLRNANNDCYLSLNGIPSLNTSAPGLHVDVTRSTCGNGCRDKWDFYANTNYNAPYSNAAATESACRSACQSDSACVAATWNSLNGTCWLANSASTINLDGTAFGYKTFILYRQPYCDRN